MNTVPRIAFFSDSYHEANGVARTTRALEACALQRGIAMLSVHAGPETRLVSDGSIVRFDLKRSRLISFGLEHDMRFDLLMWRYASRVADVLRRFSPDVLHFTGPSDIGQLGAFLGHRLGIPMVGSWHTNLHEYAAQRLTLRWVSDGVRAKTRRWAEDQSLRSLLLFYRIPRVLLAPNEELRTLLAETGRPTFLMPRGVDTSLFTPAKRRGANTIVNIGYVGRLSAEKNVRLLRAVEEGVEDEFDVRFTIVGDGGELEWLRQHMRRAEFTGILRGDALAEAFAQMDVFVFPSETETVGNVVLEAMSSGVPVVATARGGARFLIDSGRSGVVAQGREAFVAAVRCLLRDGQRRKTMGAAARSKALRIASWDQIFQDVCQAYQAAISLQREQRAGSARKPPAPPQAVRLRDAAPS